MSVAVNPSVSGGGSGGSSLSVTDVSSAYTIGLSDLSGTMIAFHHPAADTTARTWAIPSNATAAFPVGTRFVGFVEQGSGNITLTCGDTLQLEGTAATTGTRLITTGGAFVATKVAPTVWMVGGPGVS